MKNKTPAPLLALIISVFSVGAIAHNNVVVVNLGGDEVQLLCVGTPASGGTYSSSITFRAIGLVTPYFDTGDTIHPKMFCDENEIVDYGEFALGASGRVDTAALGSVCSAGQELRIAYTHKGKTESCHWTIAP